jgi:hypothetical protein
MGCILVCCFESLVGNIASAHAHGVTYSHSNCHLLMRAESLGGF